MDASKVLRHLETAALRTGRDVVMATGTASGKTLVYSAGPRSCRRSTGRVTERPVVCSFV